MQPEPREVHADAGAQARGERRDFPDEHRRVLRQPQQPQDDGHGKADADRDREMLRHVEAEQALEIDDQEAQQEPR